MELGSDKHGGDETLELYALGTLAGPKLVWLEEHLFLCSFCQQRLEKADAYVISMRKATAAAVEQQVEQPDGWVFWRRAMMLAAALMLAVVFVISRNTVSPAAVTVKLQALRGPAGVAAAPAGRPLRLTPDVMGVETGGPYRLEVVSATGTAVWSGPAQGGKFEAKIPALHEGTYFVRLYAPAGGLLREFGLDVR